MRRKSVYQSLRYIVQCQPAGQAFFEPIAAFNFDGAAIGYAKDCTQGALPGFRYRVTDQKNNEPKCIFRSDVNA